MSTGPHPELAAEPHILEGKFEPEAREVHTCISDAALTSIAVSLKRIADALDSHGAEISAAGGLNNLLWQLGDSFGRGMRP